MSGHRPNDEPPIDERDRHDGELPPPPPVDGTPTPDHDRDLVVDDNDRLVDRDAAGEGDRTVDRDADRMIDRDRDLVDERDDRLAGRDRDLVEDRRGDDDADRVVAATDRRGDRDLDGDREIAVVRTRSFSVGQLITLAIGGVLLALGIVALIRTGIETPFEEHVEDVLGWNHTPLLALIEIGTGAVLVLSALRPGGRFLAGIIGLALVAGGVIIASEPDWTVENLAAEQGFGWLVAIGGAAAVVAAIITPRRHQVVTGTPVDDRV